MTLSFAGNQSRSRADWAIAKGGRHIKVRKCNQGEIYRSVVSVTNVVVVVTSKQFPSLSSTNLIFSIFRSNFLHLFPEYLPCSQVIVKPNQSNAIYIPKPLKPSETESVIDVETQSHIELMAPGSRGQEQFKLTIGCCILPSFSRMDGKIMKYAKEIIHTKSRKGATPAGMVPLEQRMVQLERRLDLILQKLNIASAS